MIVYWKRVYAETRRSPENKAILDELGLLILRLNLCDGKHTKGRKCSVCK